MKKVKAGQFYKSKTSNVVIEVINRSTGNGHWNTRKTTSSKRTHRIHEGTLAKYWELIE